MPETASAASRAPCDGGGGFVRVRPESGSQASGVRGLYFDSGGGQRPSRRGSRRRFDAAVVMSEFPMPSQIRRPIRFAFVEMLNGPRRKFFANGQMEHRDRFDLSKSLRPFYAAPEISGLACAVLTTDGIRVQLEVLRVNLDAVSGFGILVRKIDCGMNHPAERDVRESRLVFGIAAAVGMLSQYPEGYFPDVASALVDVERRAQFEQEGAHYESSYFLTFLYLPPAEEAGRAERFLFEGRDRNEHAEAREVQRGFVDRTERVVLTVQQADAAKETSDEAKKRAHRRYADGVAALSKAFALAAASEEARAIREEAGFSQAIHAALVKSLPGDGKKSSAKGDWPFSNSSVGQLSRPRS
jgi:hypothetical protein